MKKLSLKDFDIAFTGLKLGEHRFDYQLTNEFFSLFEYDDFLASGLRADVSLTKKENRLEWHFQIRGTVQVPCDVTNEPFDMPLEHDMELVVKFGEEYDDTRDEILILPSGEHRMNIAHYLYETAVLAVPLKRVSEEGLARQEAEKSLKSSSKENDENSEIDPRWNKLKDLLS